MKLLPDWRKARHWWSVRFAALGALVTGLPILAPDALQALWNSAPAEVRQLLPAHIGRAITCALFVAVIVARIIKQRKSHAQQPQP